MSLGFKLLEAVDGQQALNLLPTHPDLILMDLLMPVMDGFEAIRQIRQIPEFKEVIIIGVSASVSEHIRQQSLAVGCHDFLAKPVQLDELLDCLARHLQLEWRYAEPPLTPDDQPIAEIGALALPAITDLRQLVHFAQGGQRTDIRQFLAVLVKMHPEFVPFAERIDQYAANFEFQRIIDELTPYTHTGTP